MYNNQNEKDMSVSYNSVDVFQYEGSNLKYEGHGIYAQNYEWVSFNAPQKKDYASKRKYDRCDDQKNWRAEKILI
jgi:hypothetical protein